MLLYKHAETQKIIGTNYYVYANELNTKYFYPVNQAEKIDYFLIRHPFDRLVDTYLFEIKLAPRDFRYTQSQIPIAKALKHKSPFELSNTTLEEVILNLNKILSYNYPIFEQQTKNIDFLNVEKIIKTESDLEILSLDLNTNLIPPNNYLPAYFNISQDLLNIIYDTYKKDFDYGGYSLNE